MDPEVVAAILALEKAGQDERPGATSKLLEGFYADHICRLQRLIPTRWPAASST